MTADAIASVRELLSQHPTQRHFQMILSVLEQIDDDAQRSVCLDYLKEHLATWPPHVCFDLHGDLSRFDGLEEAIQAHQTVPVKECLQRCLDAVKDDSLPKALDWAVTAWHNNVHEELASLVDTLDTMMPLLSLDNSQKEWLAAAAIGDSAKLGPLWRSITSTRKTSEFGERIQALRGWAHDPRTTTAILDLLRQMPWTSNGSQKYWRALLALLEGSPDPRLEDIVDCSREWSFRQNMVSYMAIQLHKAKKTIAPKKPKALKAGEKKLLKKILGSLNVAHEEATSASIWQRLIEAPGDENARLEVIDGLLASGDPRGRWLEIHQQEKPPKAERSEAKALMAEHREAWLGPFAKFITKSEKYRRGWLDKIKIKKRSALLIRAAKDDPNWATVRVVEGLYLDFLELLEIPHLRCVETLEIKADDYDAPPQMAEMLQKLAAHPISETLRSFSLSFDWFANDFSGIMRLMVDAFQLEAFPALESFTFANGSLVVEWRTTANGAVVRTGTNYYRRRLETFLWNLPSDELAAFELTVPTNLDNGIRSALSRQTRLVTVEGLSGPLMEFDEGAGFEERREELRELSSWQRIFLHLFETTPHHTQHNYLNCVLTEARLSERLHFRGESSVYTCSPDGRFVAHRRSGSREITYWEADKGPSAQVFSFEGGGGGTMWFAPRDEQMLLWLEHYPDGQDKSDAHTQLNFSAFDLANGDCVDQQSFAISRGSGPSPRIDVKLHPDGERMFMLRGGALYQLSFEAGEHQLLHEIPGDWFGMSMSPSGRWLLGYTMYNPRDKIWAYDTDSNTFVWMFGSEEDQEFRGYGSHGLPFTSDESAFYVCESGHIYRYTLESGEREYISDVPLDSYLNVFLTPDDSQLVVVTHESGISLVDVATSRHWFSFH